MEIDELKFERRCPRLGGTVNFRYCREHATADELPCWKIFDCWWETFDVVGYLEKALPPEIIQRTVQAKPKPKVASLVEIIQQAQNNLAEKKGG